MAPELKAKAKFTGCVDKPTFYIMLDYIDKMKANGWVLVKHGREDFFTEIRIDYELEKYS